MIATNRARIRRRAAVGPFSTDTGAVDDTSVATSEPEPPGFDPTAFAAEMQAVAAALPTDIRAAARSLAHTVITGSDAEAVAAAAELMRRSGFSIVSVDGSVIALPADATFSDIPIAAELIGNVTATVRAGSLYSVESVGNLLFHLKTVDAPMPWHQLAVAVAAWGKDDQAPSFIVSAAAALRALSGERGQVFSAEMPVAEQGLDALQLLILLGHAGGVPVPVPVTVQRIVTTASASGFGATARGVRPLDRSSAGRLASPPAPDRCETLKKQLSPDDATALAKLGIDLSKWGWGQAVDHAISYWAELAALPGGGTGDLAVANRASEVLTAFGVANTVASYISIVMLLLGATLDLKTDKPATHYKHADGSRAEEVTAVATATFESILSQERIACFGLVGLDVPKDGPLAGINVRWSLGQDLRPSTTGQLASSAHFLPTAASVPKFTLDQTDTTGKATVILKPAVEDDPGEGTELKASVTLVAHLEKGEFPFSLSDLLLALEMNPVGAVIGKTIEGLKSIAIDELLPTAKVTIGVKYHGAEPVFVKIENSVNLILYEIPRVYADLYSCRGIEGPYTGVAGYSAVGIGGFGQWSSQGLGALEARRDFPDHSEDEFVTRPPLRSPIVQPMPPTVASLREDVQSIAEAWKFQRSERQARRNLERVDFDALSDAGFLLTVVPEDMGGLWRDTASSARTVCELLRLLASADPAVGLVSAMHPSVVAFWLLNPDQSQPAWEAQRRAVFASAAAGEQWGTITSEPGSGGDIGRTRATAMPTDDIASMVGRPYAVTGDKHFGSGSGIADRMITTAIPDDDNDPTIFVLDVRDRPWDGTAGLTLIAEWDGVGMAATQSHAMRLDRAPGVRLARHGPLTDVTAGAGAFVATLFTAVIVGVVDEAVSVAKQQLRPRAADLRAYEQVEWTRAVNDHWLAVQAYEGSLRMLEAGDPTALFAALCAKEAVAELAEATLGRLARVLGGGTFSRRSPFAHWNEDVRALGFLRPPWGLAYDSLFALSFA